MKSIKFILPALLLFLLGCAHSERETAYLPPSARPDQDALVAEGAEKMRAYVACVDQQTDRFSKSNEDARTVAEGAAGKCGGQLESVRRSYLDGLEAGLSSGHSINTVGMSERFVAKMKADVIERAIGRVLDARSSRKPPSP